MANLDQASTLVNDPSGSPNALTRTLTSVPAGAVLVGWLWGYNSTIGNAFSDSVNGSWGAPRVEYANPGTSDRIAIFAFLNSAASSSMTVSMDPSTTAYHCAGCGWSAMGAGQTVQVASPSGATAFSTAPANAAITPTYADNLTITAMTHNSGNPTISAGSGFTLIAKQQDYGGAVQPGAVEWKGQSAATAVTGAFSLTSGVTWSCVTMVISAPASLALALPTIASGATLNAPTVAPGAVTLAPPAIASTATLFAPTASMGAVVMPFLASAAILFAPTVSPGAVTLGTAFRDTTAVLYPPLVGAAPATPVVQFKWQIIDATQSGSLTLDTAPTPGNYLIAWASVYNVEPGTGYISDNRSNTWTRDVSESPAPTNDGGVAVYSAPVVTGTAPFTVTLNTTPVITADSWFTWGVMEVAGITASGGLVEDTASDGGYETQFPSPGTLTPTSSDWFAVSVLSKRAHANDTISPPSGWTDVGNNPENSAHQSGAGAYVKGTGTSNITPTWSLFNLDGPSFRSAAVIYRMVSSSQDVALPAIASGATLFAPTVMQAVTLPTIGTSAQTFAPAVVQVVAVPAIGSTAALYAPTVAPGATPVALPFLISAAVLNAPTATPGAVTLALVSLAESALFPPTVANAGAVALPTIDSAAALFAPSVAPGAVTLDMPSIASTVLFAPAATSGFQIALPAIDSTAQLFAPAAAPGGVAIDLPVLVNVSVLHAPVVSEMGQVVLPFLANVNVLFAPSVVGTAGRYADAMVVPAREILTVPPRAV